MKIAATLRESLRLYQKNFSDLLLALLLELALRGICLAPLLCLVSKDFAWGAWACVPLYLLIALPARQNYALALQDMMNGGRVLGVRLVSTEDYVAKLLRGLLGTVKMLLWAALSIAGLSVMYAIYDGLVDGFTAMRLFSQLGGGSTVDGITLAAGGIALTLLLPIIGCAVHCGHRHAVALGDAGLTKGHRGKLIGLWAIGLALLLPFAAVVLITLGNWLMAFLSQLTSALMSGFKFEPLGARVYILAAAVVALLLPVLPLKNMLPAVYLRGVKESKTDAAP